MTKRGCWSSKFLPHRLSAFLPHPHYMTKLAQGKGIQMGEHSESKERKKAPECLLLEPGQARGIFPTLAGFGLVFSQKWGIYTVCHRQWTQILFTDVCKWREWHAEHVEAREDKMPPNAFFSSRGQARGRGLHSSCRNRPIGYIAPADCYTGKAHLYNLHSQSTSQICKCKQ